MKLSGVLTGAFTLMLCLSCSVKENRDVCPCRLFLDFRGVDTSSVQSMHILATTPDGFIFNDVVVFNEDGQEVELGVPRNDLYLNLYHGVSDSYLNADGLLIPRGQQSPQVYMHSVLLDTRREWLREKVGIKKSHCVITIRIKNDSGFSCDVSLHGNVNGMDRLGEPNEGDFVFILPGSAEEGFKAVVPRQRDKSLRLCVSEPDGLERYFALGEYLDLSGYDWTRDILDDVTVWLDYSRTDLEIKIEPWDGKYDYDIVI